LVEIAAEIETRGDFLMLGRQGWGGVTRGAGKKYLIETLEVHNIALPESMLEEDPETRSIESEPFFSSLGFTTVESMDVSDFEDATIIHDLGVPVPENLTSRFDVIYDGGTCEHVFDISEAYRNVDRMLRPLGYFVAHSPLNNWVNHGFFQISPEVVFGFWKGTLGYDITSVKAIPMLPRYGGRTFGMSDPTVTGKRVRFGKAFRKANESSQMILEYVVRKPETPAKPSGAVYQTDYLEKWDKGGTKLAAKQKG